MIDLLESKKLLLETTRACYSEKLFAGTSGNLSLYNRESGLMLITPSSYPYEKMTLTDIVVLFLDGTPVEAPHAPSSEWRMHAEIYKAKPEVGAIVHTHSPYATAFAVNHCSIPVILIEMPIYIGGDVPLARFAVPGTADVGCSALEVLRDRPTCLLANHGVVAVGANLAQAHTRATYVEDAARIYSIALSNGAVHPIPEACVRQMLRQ